MEAYGDRFNAIGGSRRWCGVRIKYHHYWRTKGTQCAEFNQCFRSRESGGGNEDDGGGGGGEKKTGVVEPIGKRKNPRIWFQIGVVFSVGSRDKESVEVTSFDDKGN